MTEQKDKVTVIDDRSRDEEAEAICKWATARAGVIVIAPLMIIAFVGPLEKLSLTSCFNFSIINFPPLARVSLDYILINRTCQIRNLLHYNEA